MGYYYKFYRPHDMKLIDEGSFMGMPFYYENLPVEIPMFSENDNHYDTTGLLDRRIATILQEQVMPYNKTMFTDLMDEHNTEVLIFRIT